MQCTLDSSISKKTSMIKPQSHSFSQGCGIILPTSLSYFALFTRGCLPWRPDAVVGTTYVINEHVSWIFKHRRTQSENLTDQDSIPHKIPLLQARCFQGHLMFKRKENAFQSIHKNYPNHTLLPCCMHTLDVES